MFLTPFNRISRDVFDDDFDRASIFHLTRPTWKAMQKQVNHLKSDLHETKDGYELSIEAPGVEKQNIDICTCPDDNSLKITVNVSEVKEKDNSEESTDDPASKKPKMIWKERTKYTETYSRKFNLPKDCDVSTSEAKMEDGLLKICIKKTAAEDATRRIKID